jgi:hypothetical protein
MNCPFISGRRGLADIRRAGGHYPGWYRGPGGDRFCGQIMLKTPPRPHE